MRMRGAGPVLGPSLSCTQAALPGNALLGGLVAWQAARTMAEEVPSTSVHRVPTRPEASRGRCAFVCAFPRPVAVPLPDSGTVLGRAWLASQGLPDSEVSTSHLRI